MFHLLVRLGHGQVTSLDESGTLVKKHHVSKTHVELLLVMMEMINMSW